MYPLAKSEGIIGEELDNEFIIYDTDSKTAHCLNPLAREVWQYCNGLNSIDDIAKLLSGSSQEATNTLVDIHALVWIAVDELTAKGLIKSITENSLNINTSRRMMLRKGTLFSMGMLSSLFPLIRSLKAPAYADILDSCRFNATISGCEGGCSGLPSGRNCRFFSSSEGRSCSCV